MSDSVETDGTGTVDPQSDAASKAHAAYQAALDAGQSEEAAHAVGDELFAKLTAPVLSEDAASSGAEAPVLTANSDATVIADTAKDEVQKIEYSIEERVAQVEGAIKHLASILGHDIVSLFPSLKK